MKKAVLILAVALLSAFVFGLTACNNTGAVVSVEFADENLKSVYEIDEILGLDEVKINIIYEKGVKSSVVSADKINGFDTRTCGERTLNIDYEGHTAEWSYAVEYRKEINRPINTSARVILSQKNFPNGIRREVRVEKSDLTEISAMIFTVKANDDFADKDFTRFEVEPSPSYSRRLHFVDSKTVRVLIFAVADTDEEIICDFSIAGAVDCTVKLSEISVSDGENDYNLPETEEV